MAQAAFSLCFVNGTWYTRGRLACQAKPLKYAFANTHFIIPCLDLHICTTASIVTTSIPYWRDQPMLLLKMATFIFSMIFITKTRLSFCPNFWRLALAVLVIFSVVTQPQSPSANILSSPQQPAIAVVVVLAGCSSFLHLLLSGRMVEKTSKLELGNTSAPAWCGSLSKTILGNHYQSVKQSQGEKEKVKKGERERNVHIIFIREKKTFWMPLPTTAFPISLTSSSFHCPHFIHSHFLITYTNATISFLCAAAAADPTNLTNKQQQWIL